MKKSLLLCAAALVAFSAIADTPRKCVSVKSGRTITPDLSQMKLITTPAQEFTGVVSVKEAASEPKKSVVLPASAKKETPARVSKMQSLAVPTLQAAPMEMNNYLPTLEQARLQMQFAKAQAAGEVYPIAPLYNGAGQYALNGTPLPGEWQTNVAVSNDTVLFQQLIPYSSQASPVVYGLIGEDGMIRLPKQMIGAVQNTYGIFFGGMDKTQADMDTTLMLPYGDNLLTNATFMYYPVYTLADGQLYTMMSAYYQPSWVDASKVASYDDATFTYVGVNAEGEEWEAYAYVEGDKLVDGAKVTIFNLIDASIGAELHSAMGVFNAADSTIIFPVQYIGEEVGFSLWLASVDDDDNLLPLTLSVHQNGHVLMSSSTLFDAVVCYEGELETIPTALVKDSIEIWNGTESILLYDTLAVLAENPLPTDTYYAYGISNFGGVCEWTTSINVNALNGELRVSDLLAIEDLDEGWSLAASYDEANMVLSIPCPQVVDSFQLQNGEMYYAIFLAIDTADANLNTATFELDKNGNFVSHCILGVRGQFGPTLDSEVDGWYDFYLPGAEWTTEYKSHGPKTASAAGNFMLNYSLQNSYYGGTFMYGAMPADADMTFVNKTPAGTYDSLSWSMGVLGVNDTGEDLEIVDYELGSGETFTIHTEVFGYYEYPVLKAVDSENIAVSNSLNGGSTAELQYIQSGCNIEDFLPRDYWEEYGTPMAMRASFNQGFGSQPASIGNGIAQSFGYNHLYCYQGKPSAPIYFKGITVPGRNFSFSDDSEMLTCRIRACQRDAEGKIQLGDTLYTSEVSVKEAWTETYGEAHYGYIQFKNFYQTVAGFTFDVDYMQVNKEFCVEIAWKSGSTIKYNIFAESNPVDENEVNTYWSADAGEYAGGVNIFVNGAAATNTWIAFDEFMYGFLYTEDDKEITLAGAGDSIDIVIYPYLCSFDEAGNAFTALWLNDESDDVTCLWDEEEDQLESWLSAEIVDEYYASSDKFKFTLRLKAEALPEGESERELHIKFEQWGSEIDFVVKQDKSTSGIKSVKSNKMGAVRYDLVGRRTQAKGMVVSKDAKAVLR